jgi:hypothetical protein
MSTPEDDKHLPGGPSKILVRRVRSSLAVYRIRPLRETWRLTWEWANEIANSYASRTRKHWPLVNEIATQYIVLLLAKMKNEDRLRLPFRANRLPQRVAQALRLSTGTGVPMSRLILTTVESQLDEARSD